MKATCPKCGHDLRLWNWRPNCPYCGVNMVQYRMEERLQDDADKAELEYAVFRPKLDRCKAATIGSKFAVLRLCCALLPTAAFALPLTAAGTASGDSTAVYFHRLFPMIAQYLAGTPLHIQEIVASPVWSAVGVLLLLTSVLALLIHLAALPYSCKSRGARFVRRAGALALTAAAGSLLTLLTAALVRHTVTVGAGMILYAALLAGMFVVDRAVQKRGVPIQYTECTIAGIPAEEYRLLLDNGMTPAQIRASRTRCADETAP